jgi:hypothetical protein
MVMSGTYVIIIDVICSLHASIIVISHTTSAHFHDGLHGRVSLSDAFFVTSIFVTVIGTRYQLVSVF